MSSDTSPPGIGSDRARRLGQIIGEVIARRLAGELLADDVVIAAHRDLLPELADRLRELALVDQARDVVDATMTSASGSDSSRRRDPPRVAPADAHLPEIEGYRILGVLGQGGMGVVFRAEQNKLKRAVALKVLPAMVGAASAQAVQRFRREATAAARLHHTNIIPIYDFGESPHAYYYAMELVHGSPLDEVIVRFAAENIGSASPSRLAEMLAALTPESAAGAADRVEPVPVATGSSASRTGSGSSSGRGRIYYDQVARWMVDAADALHYAHGEKIVHRDIKPGNLLVSVDGRIMIADFGLALVMGEDSMTMSGSLVGTLRYMSPEQAMGKRMGIDHRTDIWSLGAVMYELLTFQAPFRGGDQKEVLSSIMTREPLVPHKIIPSIPRDLETICLKALEKDAGGRFPTARAMAEELRRYLNDLPIATKPPGLVGRAAKFVRRRRTAFVGVTAGAVLTLALVLGARSLVGILRPAEQARIDARRAAKQARIDARRDEIRDEYRKLDSQKDWPAAEQVLRTHLEADPDDPRALFNLAIVLKELYNRAPPPSRNLNLLREADSLCQQARRFDPDNDLGLNAHGVILKILGDYDRAIAAYSRAAERNPDSFHAWGNIGTLYALKQAWPFAEEKLAKSVKLAGTKADAGMYWRNLAGLQLHQGRASDASASIAQALKCDPDGWTCAPLAARVGLAAPDGPADTQRVVVALRFADGQAQGKDPLIKRMLAVALVQIDALDAKSGSARSAATAPELAQAITCAEAAIKLGDLPCINHLITAVAHAELGEADAARAALELADQTWPAELRAEGGVRVTADRGLLWFDTAAELRALRDRAHRLLP